MIPMKYNVWKYAHVSECEWEYIKENEWAAYNEELRKAVEKNRNAVSLFMAFTHYLKNKDIWPTT